MSHISKIDLQIKDLDAVKAACHQLGYEFCENKQSYKWYGRWVGDTPRPDNVDIKDLGTCDHAIKVPGAKYEIGLKKLEGDSHYTLLFDYYRPGRLSKEKVSALKQPYAVAATKNVVKKMRYRIAHQKTLNDGAIQLRVRM